MKALILILTLVAISLAGDIPYTIVNGTIVWKPIPNDIQK